MIVPSRLLLVATLALCAFAARAQQPAEPGMGSTQVTPASATPPATTQPNLRVDSKPHTDASPSTDSGPPPETLGPDQQIPPDLGLDYSAIPEGAGQQGFTEIFSSKGVTRIPEQLPVVGPVTNPPEPKSFLIPFPAQPPVRHMPTPPDPTPKPDPATPPS